VVDECRGTEPQLSAVLTTRVHHTEVIDSRTQEPRFLVMCELCQTTDQTSDLLTFQPSPPSASASSSPPSPSALSHVVQYRTISTASEVTTYSRIEICILLLSLLLTVTLLHQHQQQQHHHHHHHPHHHHQYLQYFTT